MKLTVNGQQSELPDGWTLFTLLEHLSLSPDRIAIERNRQIIPRERWAEVFLAENDSLEIVQFVGGGEMQLYTYLIRWPSFSFLVRR
ncbi:MAG TPA: sulfur carrier protein ThiS [Candidatus Acidoferrales bacterium]